MVMVAQCLQIRCAVVVLVDPTFGQSQLLPSGTNVQTCIRRHSAEQSGTGGASDVWASEMWASDVLMQGHHGVRVTSAHHLPHCLPPVDAPVLASLPAPLLAPLLAPLVVPLGFAVVIAPRSLPHR